MNKIIERMVEGEILKISGGVTIPIDEIQINSIRAQGAGGQNVNKVSSAVHLRFDIGASSLPAVYKERLLSLRDKRITAGGIVVIKAQQSRSLEMNRKQALLRLQTLINKAALVPKIRKPTRPTVASRIKRLDEKNKRGRIKALRAKITND
jgi:ribosome-associated protein